MNELNQDPKAKIEKYKTYLTQRDQDEIMGALNHFNSPLLNVLGRPNAVFENNIVDYINKDISSHSTSKETVKESNTPTTPTTTNETVTPLTGSELFTKVRDRIRSKETSMDLSAYKKVNQYTDHGKKGSGAWGAYQFIWHWHGNKIKDITGVKDQQEFLNNPKAQEKYFEYHYDSFLRPNLEVFKMKFPNSGLNDEQILEGLHFRGAGGKNGLFEIFEKGLQDTKLEANNPTVNERLKA